MSRQVSKCRSIVAVVVCALFFAMPCYAESGGHVEHLSHGNSDAKLTDAAEAKTELVLYTIAVFLLLLAILSKFAWPVVSEMLAEREQRIEDNIAGAQAKHDEAKHLLAEHEAKLANTAGEVRQLMEEARRDAEHTKSQILAEAKQAADQERDRAVRDVERAANQAMKNLAETSANLAVDLASNVVRQNITPDQQAQLVRDALSKLVVAKPSDN